MTRELTDEEVWAWWCDQSAAQGLSPEITDPAIIARVVTLALAGSSAPAQPPEPPPL